MDFTFKWDKAFHSRTTKKFDKAQDFIDKECIEKMSEYVPVALPIYDNAGYLKQTVEIAEPGKIMYTGFNAKRQYYGDFDHSNSGNPKATKLWFETMKSKHGDKIKSDAQKILGKK